MKRLSDVSNEAVHRGSCVWLKGGKREDGCGRDLVEVWEQKKKKKEKKGKEKTKFFARDHTNFGEAYGRKEELKLK